MSRGNSEGDSHTLGLRKHVPLMCFCSEGMGGEEDMFWLRSGTKGGPCLNDSSLCFDGLHDRGLKMPEIWEWLLLH